MIEINILATALIATIAFYIRFCFIQVKNETQSRALLKAHIDYWANHILVAEKSNSFSETLLKEFGEKESKINFSGRLTKVAKEHLDKERSRFLLNLSDETPELSNKYKKEFVMTTVYEEHAKSLKSSVIEGNLWIDDRSLSTLSAIEVNLATTIKHCIVDLLHIQESARITAERLDDNESVVNHHLSMVFDSAKAVVLIKLLQSEISKNLSRPFLNKLARKLLSPV